MAIYVDELKPSGWKYGYSCHLFADTLTELHTFAVGSLGLKRLWFQDKRFPHYDLTPRKRQRALRSGAIEIKLKAYLRHYGGSK